jgi:hypothetical protein
MHPDIRHPFPYFPMVWGFDLAVQPLGRDHILVKGKVPVLEADFRLGRDLYSCYLSSVKTEFGQKSSSRRSPHITFANATTDQELLDFVREYGPIAPIDIKEIKPDDPAGASLQSIADSRDERWATEDISSLRRERQIYACALGLMSEIKRGTRMSDVAAIRKYVSGIVDGVTIWPDQWENENRWRATNRPFPIAWQFDSNRCDRLWNLKFAAEWEPPADDTSLAAVLGKSLGMSPFTAGEMTLCELINAFPAEIQCFNDHPIESLPIQAVSFGVRPCLYLILRREFLSGGGTAICRNDRCNRFFVSERSGQVFCGADCSRQCRQRKYWSKTGSKRRKRLRAEGTGRQKRR